MKKFLLVTLLCMAQTLFAQIVLDEGFENGNVFENPPTGWICDSDGWFAGEGIQNHEREPHSGDWYAYLAWSKDHWMFKEVSLTAGETYNFSLWYKTDGIAGFSFEVKWGNDTLPTAMTEEIFPLTEVNNDTYVELNTSFSPSATGVYYIGIHGVSTNSPWYLCVDDILLKKVVDYSFAANRLNEDTVIKAGESHDYFIEIENTGLNDDVINLNHTSEWPATFVDKEGTNTITSLSLQAGEIDTIILRQSVPSTGVTFGQIEETYLNFVSDNSTYFVNDTITSTAVTSINSFPLVYGFEEELFPALGWQANIIEGTRNFERKTVGEYPTCVPHDSSAAMAYYNSFSAQVGHAALLVSPELELGSEEYVVRFWVFRTDDIDNKADKFEIYLSNDDNLSDAELLGEVHRTISMSPIETTEGWFEYSYVFDGNSSSKYIIFKAVSAYGWNMYLDDIKIAKNTADTEAPEFISIGNLNQYADLEMPVEIVIRDESAVVDTMVGIYNVGNGDEYFELVKNTDGDYMFFGNIPAQLNNTSGTVKFLMEDIHGNSAETELFNISWEGIAPLLEESFEGDDFPPAGWERIEEPLTWFIWNQESTVEYEDSDGVVYTVVPPQGDKQAAVGWDYQYNSQDEWLISPPVEITENANLSFETFAQLGSNDYDNFIVAISVNAGAWQEIWNAFYEDNQVIQYDEVLSFSLEEYVGQTIRVAWRAYNAMYDNLWYSWFIDDVRIEKVLGEEEIEHKSNFEFSIFPNPAIDEINIKMEFAANGQSYISLTDLNGREVLNFMSKKRNAVIDISKLPKGMYFITVSNSRDKATKRFVKVK